MSCVQEFPAREFGEVVWSVHSPGTCVHHPGTHVSRYCTVLSTVLYYTVLYYTILYYTILYCTAVSLQCSAVLYYIQS